MRAEEVHYMHTASEYIDMKIPCVQSIMRDSFVKGRLVFSSLKVCRLQMDENDLILGLVFLTSLFFLKYAMLCPHWHLYIINSFDRIL